MAVVDLVPGLEVCVSVEGKDLVEYEDDERVQPKPGPIGEYQARRTVTRYIESESDKTFRIDIRLHPVYKMECAALCIPVRIDGKLVQVPAMDKALYPDSFRHNHPSRMIQLRVEGVQVDAPGGQQLLRKFRFAKIDIDEAIAKDANKDAERIEQMGQITVDVMMAQITAGVMRAGHINDSGSAVGVGDGMETMKVHEKALKGQAKSHSTSFGPAQALTHGFRFVRAEYIDGKDYPQARFVFNYRSKEALKQLLIIERTPSPDPEDNGPIDVEALDSAQKSRLTRFMQNLVRPGRGSSNGPDRLIKRERNDENENPRKKRAIGKKITIDLTGDTEDEDDD